MIINKKEIIKTLFIESKYFIKWHSTNNNDIWNYKNIDFIGIWKNGIWENGIFKVGDWNNGIWKKGIWEYGSWFNGTWIDGIWEYGYWHNGIWKNGTWKNGTWEKGKWINGIWKKGEIYSKKFNRYIGSKVNPIKFYKIEAKCNTIKQLESKIQ